MPEFLTGTFGLYVLLGIFAQLVDGALGMAYGLIVTSTLLAAGWPPAIASASVHAAEVVTTGLAGASHVWHRNVDWKLFVRLAPAGMIGGAIGAYVLVGLPEEWVKIFVSVYLLTLTAFIARRILREPKQKKHRRPGKEVQVIPIGAAGGFFDAIGGGGWGSIVTSTLIVRGDHPRQSIGSATLSEFLVTIVVSATFIATLDFTRYWQIVVALIIGGALAAPFAGWLSRIIPVRWLMIMVALIIALLSVTNITMLFIGKGG